MIKLKLKQNLCGIIKIQSAKFDCEINWIDKNMKIISLAAILVIDFIPIQCNGTKHGRSLHHSRLYHSLFIFLSLSPSLYHDLPKYSL